MGQHTIHCMTKQTIQTSNAAGCIHIAMTFHNIKVHPDIYPGRPTTTIWIIEAQNSLQITVNADTLNDTDLTPHVFLAHMRMIAKIKGKQLRALPATKAKYWNLMSSSRLNLRNPKRNFQKGGTKLTTASQPGRHVNVDRHPLSLFSMSAGCWSRFQPPWTRSPSSNSQARANLSTAVKWRLL